MRRAPASLGIVLMFLASCAVQGTSFERATAPPGNAIIYVYRPYHYGGSALKPAVTCGDDTARIGPGGYHAFIVPAGNITCTIHNETADVVDIHADPRVYYIKEEMAWGVLSGHPHLNPMDADKAQGEIKECCVQEAQQTP